MKRTFNLRIDPEARKQRETMGISNINTAEQTTPELLKENLQRRIQYVARDLHENNYFQKEDLTSIQFTLGNLLAIVADASHLLFVDMPKTSLAAQRAFNAAKKELGA